jgi:inorganic triphosphatase YgiF
MLRGTMPKKDTGQIHLRPQRRILNRLDELAEKFQRESANQVAVEILDHYMEHWAQLEQARLDAKAEQARRFEQMRLALLKSPLRIAATDPLKEEAQGKKGKR